MAALLPVDPFQETLNASMCAPATLKMLLSYYRLPGAEKSDSELAKECGTDPSLGTSNEQFVETAKRFGLECRVTCPATFDVIAHALAKEHPVVVDWFSPGRKDAPEGDMPDGHYSIVVGLDETFIYMQDPEVGGLRTIPRHQFYRVWFDFRDDTITTWDQMVVRWMCAVTVHTH
jgi:ABC-type bacteriocin/lantibiotic exporter with double-glycine peptidase domain